MAVLADGGVTKRILQVNAVYRHHSYVYLCVSLCGLGGGGGSIFFKTPDTALYSTYVSTLWPTPKNCLIYRRSC
jgi:hypothetical protein